MAKVYSAIFLSVFLNIHFYLDDDVKSEALRVQNDSTDSKQEDLLSVRNLQKKFGEFRAVQGITFGVHYGECFGFLGINGAGKTTSFK